MSPKFVKAPKPAKRPRIVLRYPPINMYPEDVRAKKVIAEYHRPRKGHKYAFSDVLRDLARLEAKHIKETGHSLLDLKEPDQTFSVHAGMLAN